MLFALHSYFGTVIFLVTIQDVAKLAGVSTATVSRVLNNNYKVSEKRRKQVLDAVGELGYSPNIIGRNLSRNENRTILVVSSAIDDHMLRGAHHAAKELGYDIILSYSPMSDNKDALKYFENGLAGGILFINFQESDENTMELCRKYPVVMCAEWLDFPEVNLVSVHDRVAIGSLVSHLAKRGLTRFGFVGPESGTKRTIHFVHEREQGFLNALKSNGIENIPELSLKIPFRTAVDGREKTITDHYFSFPPEKRPQAYICTNDGMAVLCVSALTYAGVKVPQEVAVTGFDDRGAMVLHPRITTVAQPFFEMGAESVRMLVSIMTDQGQRMGRRVFLDHEIVLRGSTEPELE